MERWTGRVALVTGASAGMGAAIARRLVDHGMIVVGCARNIDTIQKMSEELKSSRGSLHAVRCDLRKEEEILAMFADIKAKHGGVDVCVNNAALSHKEGSILYGETEKWRDMVNVNVMGQAICNREAIKSMRERKVDDGHIIQNGGNLGLYHIAYPDIHWYGATKWMVRAITDCLRMELRAEKSRIKVSAINSGLTQTEFMKRMIGEDKARDYYERHESLSPEAVVDSVITVLATSEGVEIEELLVMPTSGHVD